MASSSQNTSDKLEEKNKLEEKINSDNTDNTVYIADTVYYLSGQPLSPMGKIFAEVFNDGLKAEQKNPSNSEKTFYSTVPDYHPTDEHLSPSRRGLLQDVFTPPKTEETQSTDAPTQGSLTISPSERIFGSC